MARQARVISETGYYHVISRGNNKSYVFKDSKDKAFYMECLHKVVEEGLLVLTAWCLMDNHVHLVVKAEPDDLAIAFKRINIKYAMRYHLTHKSVGHVFQDRFTSEVVETDEYLMLVTRYVHNNPVKAGMIKNVRGYKWSSYGRYLKGDLTEAMALVFGMFQNKRAAFEKFHQKEDLREYLEIKEDRDRYRAERAQLIINRFCETHGIVDGKEIWSNRDYLRTIIQELAETSGLSLRKIAKLVEVPYSTVQSYARLGD